jgi:hypothetical protein
MAVTPVEWAASMSTRSKRSKGMVRELCLMPSGMRGETSLLLERMVRLVSGPLRKSPRLVWEISVNTLVVVLLPAFTFASIM